MRRKTAYQIHGDRYRANVTKKEKQSSFTHSESERNREQNTHREEIHRD